MRHHEAMRKSRLWKLSLLIALSTIGSFVDGYGDGFGPRWGSPEVARGFGEERSATWKRSGGGTQQGRSNIIAIRGPIDAPSPAHRAPAQLTTPSPTSLPQKRQDDGQIQALSQRIASLSQSATSALSSATSSASSAISQISQQLQSVRQSADQAVRSANDQARQAGESARSVGQSAASVVSSANSRASSDIAANSASIESRLSSEMSVRMASFQSSASRALGDAQSRASQSILSVMGLATSAVQAANADANNVRNGANSLVSQVQGNSISATNVAIIVVVAVVGSAVISIGTSCLIIRIRRKKRREREQTSPKSGLEGEKGPAIAFREPDTGGSRFNPFGGGTGYPMDKLKMPGMSDSPKPQAATRVSKDVYGVGQSSFRLQKPPSVKSATSVRIIRVESQKKKNDETSASRESNTGKGAAPSLENLLEDTRKRASELERMERGKEIYRQSSWESDNRFSEQSNPATSKAPTSPKTPKASFGLMPKVTASPPDPLAKRRTRFNEFPVKGQVAPNDRRGTNKQLRTTTMSSGSAAGTASSGSPQWPFNSR